MFLFTGIFSFVLGTIVGSFINVVVERIDTKESIFFSRSHCPYCKKILCWWELIPVLSYFYLKGRCSFCKKKISFQYPLVEFTTGLIFLFLSGRILRFPFINTFNFLTGFSWVKLILLINFLFLFYWVFVLVTVSVYDIKKYLILNEVLIPSIILSLIWRIILGIFLVFDKTNLISQFFHYLGAYSYLFGFFSYWFSLLLGIAISTGIIAFIAFVSKERAMGWGDVILALFIGLIVGYPEALIALIIAFLIGGFTSLILIYLKKRTLKSYLPFAPFLSLGALLVILFGDIIMRGYLRL